MKDLPKSSDVERLHSPEKDSMHERLGIVVAPSEPIAPGRCSSFLNKHPLVPGARH